MVFYYIKSDIYLDIIPCKKQDSQDYNHSFQLPLLVLSALFAQQSS